MERRPSAITSAEDDEGGLFEPRTKQSYVTTSPRSVAFDFPLPSPHLACDTLERLPVSYVDGEQFNLIDVLTATESRRSVVYTVWWLLIGHILSWF